MERYLFEAALKQHKDTIEAIKQSAHLLHESVNQTYGKDLPYGFHLDMVADNAIKFGHLVCVRDEDVVPMMFGAYYHDSIEDARLSYNDVMKISKKYMNDEQAYMATEIVYALTNDKGRNRAERAGEKYYAGIRETPYAPFIKLCDRVANISFTCSNIDSDNQRMKEVYKNEVPHFLSSISVNNDDPRFKIPTEIIEVLAEVLIDDMEREEWKAEILKKARLLIEAKK